MLNIRKGGIIMFDCNRIYTNPSGTRFLCDCPCDSDNTARYILASFLCSVREKYRLADLYNHGSILILDTPNRDATVALAGALNNAIKNMH